MIFEVVREAFGQQEPPPGLKVCNLSYKMLPEMSPEVNRCDGMLLSMSQGQDSYEGIS